MVQIWKVLIILFNGCFSYAKTECSVCPRGTKPSSRKDPSIVMKILGDVKTCHEAHEMGIILLSSQKSCKELQDWGLRYCHCTSLHEVNKIVVPSVDTVSSSEDFSTTLISSDTSRKLLNSNRQSTKEQCSLCGKGETPHDPNADIVFDDKIQSCQDVHNLGDLTSKLGNDKCSFIQNIGKFICFCQKGTPPEENTCTLCDDGSPIPNPDREVMPGFTCAEMQVDARRDFPYNCRVYQTILGSYCGCNTSKTSAQYCRLCDRGLLPDPLKTVGDMSCIEHELEASLEKTCLAKRAEVGKKCCKVSGCFSGNSHVSHEDGTQISLANLRVGDMIMDGSNSYTRINSFGHRNTKKTISYLQIHTNATNRPLQVSLEHMVFQATDKQPVAAGRLKLGDSLLLHDGTISVITHIQEVYAPGVYAPFTDSGKLVVDGILVSSYIDFLPDKTPHWVSQHVVAHLFQAPHRLCLNMKVCRESYNEEGISQYAVVLRSMVEWTQTQPNVIQFVFLVIGVLLSLLFQVVEYILLKMWARTLLALVLFKLFLGTPHLRKSYLLKD